MAGAHTVKVSPSIPATVEIERGRLLGLVVGIAALTAAVSWALSAYAFDSGSSTATPATAPIAQGYMSYLGPHPATATDTPPVQGYMSPVAPASPDRDLAESAWTRTVLPRVLVPTSQLRRIWLRWAAATRSAALRLKTQEGLRRSCR